MKLVILIRSILSTILFPLTVLFWGVSLILVHYLLNSRPLEDLIVQSWGRVVCWLSGVKIRLHGAENLPVGGALFLFNHSSFFDIFALLASVKGLRFGAKAELFKIPIFAQAMSAAGNLPIARDNREEVIRIYDDAKKRFASGQKFALSPEGGRFYNSQQLSRFKTGPFVFALSAQAPLLPVIVFGAYEALPKGHMLFNSNTWVTYVDIHFLESISTEGMTFENRRQLAEKVYEQMNAIWKNGPVQ